ncbi:MAG TPA: hypothetical protein VG819_11500 [Rhizomicrobium sp.]|jgi:hypothetical protein|nr:hypothetical protein [Rhizomicrobium sp.]
MQILTPFLEMLERYNGMAMRPAADPAPAKDPLDLPLVSLLQDPPAPALTRAANR